MLQIDPEKVCFLIIKAREFDAKVDVVEPDPGSNLADEDMRGVLEDYPDDPVEEELTNLINALNRDEQVDLVALVWLGRGDTTDRDWSQVRAEALRAHNEHSAEYLLGTPLLADYLSEGLNRLGYSCASFELQHL